MLTVAAAALVVFATVNLGIARRAAPVRALERTRGVVRPLQCSKIGYNYVIPGSASATRPSRLRHRPSPSTSTGDLDDEIPPRCPSDRRQSGRDPRRLRRQRQAAKEAADKAAAATKEAADKAAAATKEAADKSAAATKEAADKAAAATKEAADKAAAPAMAPAEPAKKQ